MKALWGVFFALGCSQPAPLPDVPRVEAQLPMPSAVVVDITTTQWRIDTGLVLPEADAEHTFAAQPFEPQVIVRSKAFAHMTETLEALKARADEGVLRAPAVLVMAPEMPVIAAYPAMYALGQAGFGPFSAMVRTPKGLGSLPFEPRTPVAACAQEKPAVGQPGIHPDDRGKANWNSALDALLYGPPRRCHAAIVWQSPEGSWARWWTHWVRDRCTAAPRRPSNAPWTALSIALADPPVGERCQSAQLLVADDVTWGALVESITTLRNQGFDIIRLSLR